MTDSNDRSSAVDGHPSWSMRAVTQQTGIGEHTLRAWERRFGFPLPIRLSSGHRRYTEDQVRRILRIRRALELGHRAGDVVPLDDDALEALLKRSSPPASEEGAAGPITIETIVAHVRRFDAEGVRGLLERGAARTGLRGWVELTVAPLLETIGRLWEEGELEVEHEHFLSEILEDHLRARRRSLEAGTGGARVLLATLPGEHHALGLQLAAITIVESGLRVLTLGTDTPINRIAASAHEAEVPFVGISVSAASDPDTSRDSLTELRRLLPPETDLWVGGSGAAAAADGIAATRVVETLEELRELAIRA